MLTPRLDMILKNTVSACVADIGTDHAYIPIELAKKGARVFATDVSGGPLNIAEKNVKKSGVPVTLLLGDGLAPIPQVDEIIIAGMGGELIEKIILRDMEKARFSRLLLQPMNSQAELRQFLLENGFSIESEDLAAEGYKIYNLIIAKNGVSALPSAEIDLHLPKNLYSHPLFPMLLQKKEREFSKQYNGLLKSKNSDFAELSRLKNLLSDIENIKRTVIL